jgi:hypothetical protein
MGAGHNQQMPSALRRAYHAEKQLEMQLIGGKSLFGTGVHFEALASHSLHHGIFCSASASRG